MDSGHFLLFVQQTCFEGLPCALQGPVVPWSHARLDSGMYYTPVWVNNLELSVQRISHSTLFRKVDTIVSGDSGAAQTLQVSLQ